MDDRQSADARLPTDARQSAGARQPADARESAGEELLRSDASAVLGWTGIRWTPGSRRMPGSRRGEELLRADVSAVLGHPDADALPGDRSLAEPGFDSLTAVQIRNRPSTAPGLRLSEALVFEHRTAGDRPATRSASCPTPRSAGRRSTPRLMSATVPSCSWAGPRAATGRTWWPTAWRGRAGHRRASSCWTPAHHAARPRRGLAAVPGRSPAAGVGAAPLQRGRRQRTGGEGGLRPRLPRPAPRAGHGADAAPPGVAPHVRDARLRGRLDGWTAATGVRPGRGHTTSWTSPATI